MGIKAEFLAGSHTGVRFVVDPGYCEATTTSAVVILFHKPGA